MLFDHDPSLRFELVLAIVAGAVFIASLLLPPLAG